MARCADTAPRSCAACPEASPRPSHGVLNHGWLARSRLRSRRAYPVHVALRGSDEAANTRAGRATRGAHKSVSVRRIASLPQVACSTVLRARLGASVQSLKETTRVDEIQFEERKHAPRYAVERLVGVRNAIRRTDTKSDKHESECRFWLASGPASGPCSGAGRSPWVTGAAHRHYQDESRPGGWGRASLVQ
jgi:hypothetical protein